ncbi:MAG: hypothetical protein AB7K24_20105 [Gemmataceae bacterium]
MALKPRISSFWHFVVRLGGLTGALLLGCGLFAFYKLAKEPIGAGLIVAGGLFLLFWLVVELIAAFDHFTGERSAFGSNVVLQVLLAGVLLAGVNAFAFFHDARFDCTRERQFTIPAEWRTQLTELRADRPTRIVVHVRHVEFGTSKEKGPDNYDSAAERKVVEKVLDLVEQFRELGPRFQVSVLDVQDENYSDKLAEATRDAPELRAAIDKAPENSVFFYTRQDKEKRQSGKVQRLPFNDIYQLDKVASRAASDRKGNLKLLYQGVGPFARCVLNSEEPRPKVGIAVVHEALGTQGPRDSYTLKRLQEVYADQGIDVHDVILKKWTRAPEPAVLTYDERKYDKAASKIETLEAQRTLLAEQRDRIKRLTPQQLKERGGTEKDRVEGLKEIATIIAEIDRQCDKERRTQEELQVARLDEQRRIQDLKDKLARNLADCDLLILPRHTLKNMLTGPNIPHDLHFLDRAQVEAIRDFMKAGKPVLVCFGSTVREPNDSSRLEPDDGFENMLAELGISLGPETVLHDVEISALADVQALRQAAGDVMFISDDVKVPPVAFLRNREQRAGNPVGESLRLAARRLGDEQFALRLRYARPVKFVAPAGVPEQRAAFLWSDAASWVEE